MILGSIFFQTKAHFDSIYRDFAKVFADFARIFTK